MIDWKKLIGNKRFSIQVLNFKAQDSVCKFKTLIFKLKYYCIKF